MNDILVVHGSGAKFDPEQLPLGFEITMAGEPAQQQMDAGGATSSMPDPDLEPGVQQQSAASGSAGDPLTQVLGMLQQLIQSMPASIAAAVKKDDKFSHLDNAKLDIKNFTRIKMFVNKHEARKEWRDQFFYAIQECDHSFADFLEGMENKSDPVDTVTDLTPAQCQLSAVLC